MTHNGEADEGRDIVDETSLYTLAGTDEGWGVWDRSSPSERPAVFYPPTDDGFELAVGYFERANSAAQIRRGPWMDVLRRIALVAGGVWIATVTIANLWFVSDEESIPPDAFRWLQAFDNIGYAVFLVALGAYVVLWLRGHGVHSPNQLNRAGWHDGATAGHSADALSVAQSAILTGCHRCPIVEVRRRLSAEESD